MALKARTWRRRPVALTPLIDIIFLLLLFFMLSSTFTRFAEIPLMNAVGGSTQDISPMFLQLRADDVSLNGVAMPLDTIVAAIRERGSEESATVLITLSGEVTSQRLVDLLSKLRSAPYLSVSVLE